MESRTKLIQELERQGQVLVACFAENDLRLDIISAGGIPGIAIVSGESITAQILLDISYRQTLPGSTLEMCMVVLGGHCKVSDASAKDVQRAIGVDLTASLIRLYDVFERCREGALPLTADIH